MTRIKICGITSTADALEAVRAGADALGYVFADSPRSIQPVEARRIIERLPPFVSNVGVFLDAPFEQVREIADETGIDTVQLHGDESPQFCGRIELPVLKRFPVFEEDTRQALAERLRGFDVAGCLLDPGAGSGHSFDWSLGRDLGPPTVVAGGLTPQNVAEAIRRARPYGVDASSGLETSPGRKDPDKLRAFIDAVRETDARHAAR